MPVNSALRRISLENGKFKAILGIFMETLSQANKAKSRDLRDLTRRANLHL